MEDASKLIDVRAGIKVGVANKWMTLIQNAGHLQAVNREKSKDD